MLKFEPLFNTRGMALEKSSQFDCAKQGTGKEDATAVIKNTIKCFMLRFFYVEIDVVSESQALSHLRTTNLV